MIIEVWDKKTSSENDHVSTNFWSKKIVYTLFDTLQSIQSKWLNKSFVIFIIILQKKKNNMAFLLEYLS